MLWGRAWVSSIEGSLSRPFNRALFYGGVERGMGQLEAKAFTKVSPFGALVSAYSRRAHYIKRSAGGLHRPI